MSAVEHYRDQVVRAQRRELVSAAARNAERGREVKVVRRRLGSLQNVRPRGNQVAIEQGGALMMASKLVWERLVAAAVAVSVQRKAQGRRKEWI